MEQTVNYTVTRNTIHWVILSDLPIGEETAMRIQEEKGKLIAGYGFYNYLEVCFAPGLYRATWLSGASCE